MGRARTASLARKLAGSTGGNSASFSADGRLMLAAATSHDSGSGRPLDVDPAISCGRFEYPGARRAVLSPDGRYVAIGLDEPKDNLPIFDATSGERLRVLTSGIAVTGLAFAPDGRHLLTGSRDNIARNHRRRDRRFRELTGHTNIIWGTAFSPDGLWALTGSRGMDRAPVGCCDRDGGPALRQPPVQRDRLVSPSHLMAGRSDSATSMATPNSRRPTSTPWSISTCARLLRDFLPSERSIYEIPDEKPTCDATTSISTRAPFGRAATPTVERAGGGSPTNRP